jgi:hypothetical protein
MTPHDLIADVPVLIHGTPTIALLGIESGSKLGFEQQWTEKPTQACSRLAGLGYLGNLIRF